MKKTGKKIKDLLITITNMEYHIQSLQIQIKKKDRMLEISKRLLHIQFDLLADLLNRLRPDIKKSKKSKK